LLELALVGFRRTQRLRQGGEGVVTIHIEVPDGTSASLLGEELRPFGSVDVISTLSGNWLVVLRGALASARDVSDVLAALHDWLVARRLLAVKVRITNG
jgi:hypothetical protein